MILVLNVFFLLTERTQRELEDYYDWFQREDSIIKSLASKREAPENKSEIESLF